ncbi:VOC family protein [Frankia sp. Cpl3]|nr:VOC family protein [Frankia sp. Cpl3]
MPRTVPCLWFDTEGEEAARFYVSVFPNSAITAVTRYGPGAHRPEGLAMTVAFTLDGREYTALNGGPEFTFSEAVSFQILCADQAEVDHYWERLTDGGKEGQCGWLTDRYGLSWQVVPTRLIELVSDPDPDRAARATRAMLGMVRIDVATVERAADGGEQHGGK